MHHLPAQEPFRLAPRGWNKHIAPNQLPEREAEVGCVPVQRPSRADFPHPGAMKHLKLVIARLAVRTDMSHGGSGKQARADNPVAVVAKVAAKHRTRAVAQDYANFHYTPAAQEIFAKHGLHPSDAAVLARHAAAFPKSILFTVEQAFGG